MLRPHEVGQLRDFGLVNEQVRWKQRFFVPTVEEKSLPILAKLLAHFPAIPSEQELDASDRETSAVSRGSSVESKIVTLEDWVLPPKQREMDCREAFHAGSSAASCDTSTLTD